MSEKKNKKTAKTLLIQGVVAYILARLISLLAEGRIVDMIGAVLEIMAFVLVAIGIVRLLSRKHSKELINK